ncbi:U-box domain-containing protein 6 [Impatiens glandulifera]|uniref:U-box domain-containing protein 6 n=1 Tax=Impatiens glandulifera TaxID=253017 RepID=UPI001FB13648|nr:U-box domain-containing protein 6 [Impatiens glandulifera]
MEEALLQGLSQPNGSKHKILAAKAISNLTSKHKHSLTQIDTIINLLLPMLLHHTYSTIKASLFALLNLSFGSERNKIQIVKSGAIPILLNFLIQHESDLQEHAVALIFTLSSTAANKIPIASSSGVLTLLFNIISTANATTMQTKLDALSTLYNLSTSHEIIHSMVIIPCSVNSLVKLIIHSYVNKSITLVEMGMGVLERLVTVSDVAIRETAEEEKAIQTFVEVLEEGSFICKERAIAILLAICESCRERYRGMILREGAVPGLLQMSNGDYDDGTRGRRRSREMARDLLLLLRNDVGLGSGSDKTRIENYEILEETMKHIRNYDDDDRRCLSSGLRVVQETIAKIMITNNNVSLY